MAEIYVLDKNINILGIFNVYEAIVWDQKWNCPGSFQAQFLFTRENNELLQIENILYKTDASEAGIIMRKYLDIKEDGHEYIKIEGFMASRYLNRRIIWNKMTMTGTAEALMRKMVYEQVVNPTDPDRRIPHILLGEEHGYAGNTIEKQITYDNLTDALTDLSQQSELGYRLTLDLQDKVFYFDVLQGTNRTLGTEDPCIFSRDFQNIYKQNYEDNSNNVRTVCLIGGKGEDEPRVLETVGEGTGLSRYEMFYNAAGLSDKDLSESQYRQQLAQKGAEELAKYYRVKSFESSINASKAMKYDIGDYVTCYDTSWGITLNAQITEVENDLSKDENSVVLTLGNSAPTMTQMIKNAMA